MIANEKQYQVAKKRLQEFSGDLKKLEENIPWGDLLHLAYINTVKAKIEDFNDEIRDYEALKSGEQNTISISSIGKIPELLIRGRISRGLTQGHLAAMLHIREQQVQRDESTGYSGASITRITEIAEALEIRVSSIHARVGHPQFNLGSEVTPQQVCEAQQRLEQRGSMLIH